MTVRDPGEVGDVLWAVVLVQGAITLTSTVEAFVGAVALGSLAAAGFVISLTFFGALLALASARGLRLHRRWAKRVTMVAEGILLGLGLLGLGLSLLMSGGLVGLVPLVTTIAVPTLVLVLLVRNARVFAPEGG